MNRNLRLVSLALLFWGLGEGLFLFIQPLYIERLGANPVQIGSVLSLAAIFTTCTYIPAGALSDRYNRKLNMVGGFVLGAIAALLMALARDWRQLIPGLVLYGLSAYCIPAINNYVAHASEGQDLNRIFTRVFASYSLGLTVSPALGGWLGDLIGIRMLYLIATCSFTLATSTVLLVANQPLSAPSSRGSPRELLSNREFLGLSALFMFLFLALYIGVPLIPNYLSQVLDLNLSWIGLLGSVYSLGAVVLSLWLGRLRGHRALGLILGQGMVFFSFLLLWRTEAIPLLALAFFLRGAFSACSSLASAQMGTVLDEGAMGLGFGVLSTVTSGALILAPYLAGWLYTARPDLPFLASLALIPLAMGLTWRAVTK
jgi:MFS family permease